MPLIPRDRKRLYRLKDKERHPERVVLANQYHQMLSRCCRPAAAGYCYYGARGIGVCEEWRVSWRVFREWARSSGWKLGLYLDRIDNEKDYFPENCRWVTAAQSMRNRRCTKLSDDIVREICKLVGSGLSQSAIARQFNLHQSTVSRVKDGLRWNLKESLPCR